MSNENIKEQDIVQAKLAVIEEFENYFNSTNRAVEDGGHNESCVYRAPDGNVCGHSLFLNEKTRDHVVKHYNSDHDASSVLDNLVYDGLEEPYHIDEYAILDAENEFWNEIQNIHDESVNFDLYGLSENGRIKIAELKVQVKTKQI